MICRRILSGIIMQAKDFKISKPGAARNETPRSTLVRFTRFTPFLNVYPPPPPRQIPKLPTLEERCR